MNESTPKNEYNPPPTTASGGHLSRYSLHIEPEAISRSGGGKRKDKRLSGMNQIVKETF